MEDKLKANVNPYGFHYPNQYETMSVRTALNYLDLSRDGHGLLFSPDNYYGFKALLVLKCGIDIDYVFSDYFKEDEAEISSHMSTSELTMEELEKEVKKRIYETEKRLEKKARIEAARERYSRLNLIKRTLLALKGRNPTAVDFENMSVEEIENMYPSSAQKKK